MAVSTKENAWPKSSNKLGPEGSLVVGLAMMLYSGRAWPPFASVPVRNLSLPTSSVSSHFILLTQLSLYSHITGSLRVPITSFSAPTSYASFNTSARTTHNLNSELATTIRQPTAKNKPKAHIAI